MRKMLSISTKRLLRTWYTKNTKRSFSINHCSRKISRPRQCRSSSTSLKETSLRIKINDNPWKITSVWLSTLNSINQEEGCIEMNNITQHTSILSKNILKRIQKIKDRHDEVLDLLIKPNASTAELGKELSKLAPVSSLYEKLEEMKEEHKAINEMLDDLSQIDTNKGDNGGDDDEDMRKECEEEIARIERIMKVIESKLVDAVIPTEDDDYNADAILEIRAGTGGDEAALFANELLTTYEKTSKSKGYTCEILNLSQTELGGIREAAISISSSSYASSHFQSHDISQLDFDMNEENESDSNSYMLDGLSPYGYFKYESGVHRVQRVPVNDVRIHTSTASVAVFPNSNSQKFNDNETLPLSDLKIETFRASGAGGQHVNTTESAVRITHIPTGITAAIQDERNQHSNKTKAMKLVTARVLNAQKEHEAKEKGELRNILIGGGGRSERIRTYNFPQDRVTDHRCKHSEYGIHKLLEGGSGGSHTLGSDDESGLVSCFLPLMKRMYRDQILKEMEEEVIESNEDISSK